MSSDSLSTREKLLRAALELLEEGDPSVGLGAIAKRAGVSRQAVYLHFESRTALMLALAAWTDETLGLVDNLRAAAADPDPVARFVGTLRVAAEFELKIAHLTLLFETARHTDDALAAAWDDRMGQRRAHYVRMFEELRAGGRLQGGVDPEIAADTLWVLASPSSFRQLVIEHGWTPGQWASWLEELARRLWIA